MVTKRRLRRRLALRVATAVRRLGSIEVKRLLVMNSMMTNGSLGNSISDRRAHGKCGGRVSNDVRVFGGGVVRVIIALRLLMVLGLRRAVAARIVTRISRHDGAVLVFFGVEVVR